MNKLLTIFEYLTNNQKKSLHEREFDFVFFVLITIALVAGVVLLCVKHCEEWIPFLLIEFIWCFDNLRHNRE